MVTPHFPPKISGMAVSVLELGKRLLEFEYEVHMVVPTFFKIQFKHKSSVHPVALYSSSDIQSIFSGHFYKHEVSIDKTATSFCIPSVRKVREIAEKNSFDVVHIHSSFDDNYIAGYLEAEFREIPIILTIHGGGKEPGSRESSVWKLVPNFFDKIITVSHDLKKQLLALGVFANKIAIVPNGIDLKRFEACQSSSGIKTKYQIEDKQPLILFAGRLDPDKGVTYLLSAFIEILKELPSAKLFLAGSGYLNGFIRQAVAKLHLQRSTIIESFSYEEMPYVYAAADVVVLPSVQRDACPLSILEAMASCKPVVATNVPGITEIIANNDTGLLVSPKNSHQLANAIIKLLNNRKLASFLAEKGYMFVEKYHDVDSTSKQIMSVYEETLESRKNK